MTDTIVVEKADPVDLAVPSRFFVIRSSIDGQRVVTHKAVFGPAHRSEIEAFLSTLSHEPNAAYIIAEDVTNGVS